MMMMMMMMMMIHMHCTLIYIYIHNVYQILLDLLWLQTVCAFWHLCIQAKLPRRSCRRLACWSFLHYSGCDAWLQEGGFDSHFPKAHTCHCLNAAICRIPSQHVATCRNGVFCWRISLSLLGFVPASSAHQALHVVLWTEPRCRPHYRSKLKSQLHLRMPSQLWQFYGEIHKIHYVYQMSDIIRYYQIRQVYHIHQLGLTDAFKCVNFDIRSLHWIQICILRKWQRSWRCFGYGSYGMLSLLRCWSATRPLLAVQWE